MRNKTTLSYTIVIVFLLTLLSCNQTPEGPKPTGSLIEQRNPNGVRQTVNENTYQNTASKKGSEVINKVDVKPFPNLKTYASKINASMLKVYCIVYDRRGNVLRSWTGHSCLYATRNNNSFIALPYHVFPDLENKWERYYVEITDCQGTTIKLIGNGYKYRSVGYDAEILEMGEIPIGTPLSPRSLITNKQPAIGDTILLISPFNPRGVSKKIGFYRGDNSVTMETYFGEPGDSGGLIADRNGIIGVVVSVEDNGKIVNFVPMSVFEDLYGSLVLSNSE